MRFVPGKCVGMLAAAVAVLCAAAFARAQLPVARITSIFPPGGQSGATVQVSVSGQDLDDAARMQFSHPGITATPVSDVRNPSQCKFAITITPDVPPGVYEARVVGQYGLSNSRAFNVGGERQLPVPQGNTTPQAATSLLVNSAVSAHCTPAAADFYRLELKQGQRLLIECSTREIDSRMEPVLLLYDDDGHELDRSRHGGRLDFAAPADGTYLLQVHDLLFRAGEPYFYKLSATTAPHLDCIFPPMGQRGTTATYRLYGRCLPGATLSAYRGGDGKPLEQLDVPIEIPPAARRVDYHLNSPVGTSNSIAIMAVDGPVGITPEPGGSSHAVMVSIPCDLAGRFCRRGSDTWLSFDATAGEPYCIEIFSSRLGWPTAPDLLLQQVRHTNAGDQVSDVQEINGADAPQQARDGLLRLQPKQDGEYRLLIRDAFNSSQECGLLPYRLSMRHPAPDFELAAALPIEDPKKPAASGGICIRRGGAVPIQMTVARIDGFSGDVQVNAEGLHSGVSGNAIINAGQTTGLLLLHSHEDAPGSAGQIHIVGRARIGSREISHEATYQSVIWGGTDDVPAVSRTTADFAVGVSDREREPLVLDPDAFVAGRSGEKLAVHFKLMREAGAQSVVKIKPFGLPQLQDSPEISIDPKSGEGTIDLDLKSFPPGLYSFCLKAQAQVKYQPPPLGGSKEISKSAPREIQATFYSPEIVLKVAAAGK